MIGEEGHGAGVVGDVNDRAPRPRRLSSRKGQSRTARPKDDSKKSRTSKPSALNAAAARPRARHASAAGTMRLGSLLDWIR